MKLINHELIHFFVTFVIAVLVYYKYKSIKLVLIVVIVGMLLDIDHLFDLIHANGSASQIASAEYFTASQKAYVIFHSWELLIPWWIYIVVTKQYPLGICVSIVFITHILIDQFSYGAYPLTYFFTYRAIHNFNLSELFRN